MVGTVPLTWLPTGGGFGGSSGGYLQHVDPAEGLYTFWAAPEVFLGNKTAAYGGTLTFDLTQSILVSQLTDNLDLVLQGGGLSLILDLPYAPGTNWTSFSAPLTEGAGWRVGSPSGPIASFAQVTAALASVTGVFIRAEFSGEKDTDGLDNVILSGPSGVAKSMFDASDDGWTVVTNTPGATSFAPATTVPTAWVDSGGISGAYLEHVDPLEGLYSFWKAPAAFSGNRSGAYGGELSFALRQSATDAQISDMDVVLQGAGLTLVYDTPTNPGSSWTGYSVPLLPGSAWHVGNLSGPVPSTAQFVSALTQTSGLFIRAEYRSGPDTDGIDSVSFGCIAIADPMPSQLHICTAADAVLPAPAFGLSPFTYQWRLESPASSGNFIDITGQSFAEPSTGLAFDVVGASATSETLHIANIRLGTHADVITFEAHASNSCASVRSSPAKLTICRADFNCDSVVEDADFVLFSSAYNLLLCDDPNMPANCPADLNGDGLVDDADFVIFANAYDALLCS